MRNLTSRGSLESPHALKVFLGLRMIVLALVVGAGIMIVQLSVEDFSVGPLYVVLVLSYVVGGAFFAALQMGLQPVVGVWMLMVADIGLETVILHFSGGVSSQFSLIFCLSIIAAAFLLEVPGGLGIALLASLSYVCYGLLESRGIVTSPVSHGGDAKLLSTELLQMYMHVSLFFLVGAVGGYLAERTILRGRELHNAETQLKQLRIDTANILNNMSSGVLVVDSAGRIITINPVAEQILSVDKEDVQSLNVEAAFGSSMPEFVDELSRALQSNESIQRHEITVKRRVGGPLPLGISVSVLKDYNDKKRGVIAVFQDLTEVRDMREQIRKADRLAAIGELSAAIAHEVRNPLASINGSIEILSNELKLSGENKRLMDLIMKESDRLDRIISDFLEYARMRPLSVEEVVIAQCLDEVVLLLKNNSAINCRITMDIDDRTRHTGVRADEEQLKQVFLNLAINACEAMPDGGQLTIKTAALEDGSVRVAFQDEGRGITDEVRSRLFEPFFTTKQGGTGLGLAMANKIVEAHGGRIDVCNRKTGGAEFSIVIPKSALVKRSNRHESMSSIG